MWGRLRSATAATGPTLAERCISHSRTTVGTARSSAKCTSGRQRVSVVAAAGPRSPIRAIMTIPTREPPSPVRKAQCALSAGFACFFRRFR